MKIFLRKMAENKERNQGGRLEGVSFLPVPLLTLSRTLPCNPPSPQDTPLAPKERANIFPLLKSFKGGFSKISFIPIYHAQQVQWKEKKNILQNPPFNNQAVPVVVNCYNDGWNLLWVVVILKTPSPFAYQQGLTWQQNRLTYGLRMNIRIFARNEYDKK